MIYCKQCVLPLAAVNLDVDDNYICSACKSHDSFSSLEPEFWEKRENDVCQSQAMK